VMLVYSSVRGQTMGQVSMETAQAKQPGGMFRPLLILPVPFVFLIGYFVGARLGRWLLHQPFTLQAPRPIGIAGLALFVAGSLLAGWAWTTFHLKGTTKDPREDSTALVTTGPYAVTRNPMYVGLTLAYVGAAGAGGQILPLATLILVLAYVNWVVIPVEETRLRGVFGGAYDAYRLRVRRWLGTRRPASL
jgi:protein-S-isoprenylcysteine O-methyltransferase Ste14